MPPVLTKNGDQLELALAGCRGSEFQDAKDKIKEVPGRRFDFDRKLWIVPASTQTADRILKTIRPEADDELLAWVRDSMAHAEESLTTPLADDADLLIPWAAKRMPWQPEYVNEEKFEGALPWQRAAIDAMAEARRSILADDMGLGKTFEAISTVEEYVRRNLNPDGTEKTGPKLVVAPASVVGGWHRELHRWLENPDVVIVKGSYSGRKAKLEDHILLGHERDADGNYPDRLTADEVRRCVILEAIEREAWVLVNWEQLRVQKAQVKTRNGGTKTVKVAKEPLFEKTEWLAVIADEIHRAKNPKSQQTIGLWRTEGDIMLGLTGTPIMNSPDDLWAPMVWLWPDEYHPRGAAHKPGAVAYWDFYDDYVDYYEDHFKRKVITGVKNPEALRFVLRGKLIRRTASILGLEGRKRFYFPVDLNPGQKKLYDEATQAMWLAVEKDIAAGNKEALQFAREAAETGSIANLIRIPNGAARMTRLQQVLENAALLGGADDSALMDDFEQKFSDSRPYPWVVFCKYKESCDLLAARLRKRHGAEVGIFNGNVKPADRTKLENEFQAGGLDVMIGTIEAMYQGVTLTRSHLMYFLTRDWVQVKNDQCEAREDRLGQQELVRVYIPQPPDTVATNNVEPTNRLKQSIEKTILPKDNIEEVHAS